MKNKVLKLKNAAMVATGIELPAGQEIELVQNVVYINGNMVAPTFQSLFLHWINRNPNLFIDDTREW